MIIKENFDYILNFHKFTLSHILAHYLLNLIYLVLLYLSFEILLSPFCTKKNKM